MFTSTGVLISDPVKSGLPIGQWWLILQCCPELGRYYREIFNWENRDIKLQKPAWGTHVSVIRAEEPAHADFWGKWDGQVVEYRYAPEVQTNEEYYWLDVECDELLSIREQLGLPRLPAFGLHITIGRKN